MARKPSLLDDLYEVTKSGVQGSLGGLAQGVAQTGELLGNAANAVVSPFNGGRQVFDGSADAVRSIAQNLAAAADASRARVSAEGQQAMANTTPRGNLLRGEFDLGADPSLRGGVLNIAQGLGSAAPSLAAAAVTRGRSVRTQAATGAVVGGAMGGGYAAQDEGARIRSMPQQELAKVPAYLAAIGSGKSPDQAREIVAKAAERAAFAATAPVSAAGGAATSALLGKPAQGVIARAAGGSKVGQVVGSTIAEGLEEGVQETAEGVAQIAGANAATGETRDVGQGSAANFALGAATGGVTGAAGGLAPNGEPAQPSGQEPIPASAPGASAPQMQQPAAPAVINPARGVLSRAITKGAEAGAVDNVIIEDPVLPGLNAPPAMGMPPEPAVQAVPVTQQPVEASARAAAQGLPYVGSWGERPVTIAPNKAQLSEPERLIEARAAQQVLSDPESAIAAYEKLPVTEGGRVISVDDAREIFPEYSSGPEGRTANSVAVHEPASFVAKAVWARRLGEDVAEDREPLVVFTAGGTGAGKTSAVRRDAAAQELMDAADLIYDGNLQNVDSASARINEALDSGRAVEVLYIHRDPVDAFRNGVLPRAAKETYGRTVPIEGHLSTHLNAAKTIFALQERFKDNPLVNIQILNNAGDHITDPAADVARVASTDYTALQQEITHALEQERQAGKLPPRVEQYYFPDASGRAGAQPGAPGEVRSQGGLGADRLEGQVAPGQAQGAGEVTKTPEFQRFFAKSKIVDDRGEPLVVHHGASQVFDTFDAGRAGENTGAVNTGAGFFFTNDSEQADSYVGVNGQRVDAYLRIENPKVLRGSEYDRDASGALNRAAAEHADKPVSQLQPEDVAEYIEFLKRRGHDGIEVEINDGGDVPLFNWVAFEPTQIKSATANSGAFDPAEPSFLGRQAAKETSASFGVIVAPKPGTKVTTESGETRPYQRGVDGANQPPAAAPVQRAPDLAALQEKAQAIFKRPAAATALRKLFGVKGVKLKTIRGSYEGEPELSFQVSAEGLSEDNARQLAVFLGLAFSQDAVIVTKPDPVGAAEDSIPTLELYNTDGTKLSERQFAQVTAELRAQGVDYSEARDGRALRVLHFGDEASLEQLAVTLASAASANGLAVNHLHTRSEMYEAQDYRQHLGEGGNPAVSGQRPEVFRALVDHFVVPYTRAIGAAGYRFDPDRYAARYGLAPDQVEALKAALRKVEPRPTVGVLTGEEPIPTRAGGRPTNADAAWFLQNRAAALGEIKPDDRSPEALEALSETFAQEVEYQLSKPGGKQAIGWYDRQLKSAMATIGAAHPEIASDENAGFVFKALLAVTSQGLTVEQNFNAALKVYLRYQQTGQLDLAGITLPGKAAPVAKKNIEKLAALVKAKGLDGARQWMRETHTIRELKAAGFKDVTGRLDETVRGWHAFGPKIGSFGNNLDGDFDTLTADLWFSRTWNRALGTMFQYSAQREANSLREFRAELVKALNAPGSNAVVDALTDAERARIGDVDADLELARRMYRHFQATRFADRSALNRAAKSLTENAEMLQDVPRGDPERRWQQQVMREVQAKLERRLDQRISIADLQALLWYQEKELFRILGAANKASAPLDYQDAAKAAIAQVEGQHLGAQSNATIIDTARPLRADSLLGELRKIIPDARIVIAAGTDQAASRVAIDRYLTRAETAQVIKLGGIRGVGPGTFPTGPLESPAPGDRKVPPRFQVPSSVTASRHYAALQPEQEAQVDQALANLKRKGYPKAWLNNASFFFAHNSDLAFAARFYVNGETKGAISLRVDRFARGTKALERDLAHELAHAADFDHAIGGLYSTASPLFDLSRNRLGSIEYTGEIIAELREAHRAGTPLTAELNYPFADPYEFSDHTLKAEAFAQAVMLYFTQRADLKRFAPKAAALIEGMLREADAGPDRAARAVPQALRPRGVATLDLRAPGSGSPQAGGRVDRGGRGRPAPARRQPRPGDRSGEPGVDRGDRAGDRAGGDPRGSAAPLAGAPRVKGAAGPDPRLVQVAEDYARAAGITLRRQAEYVAVDPERAARIAAAYEAMPHAPQDPKVQAAYADLVRQVRAQYDALAAAGYKFWLMDEAKDPYEGNPWNAMRDLRANQSMAVFPTVAGFGSSELDVSGNPLLADTGLRWPYGAPDGELKPVLANDLFRAVHDAFGHGLEGAGFRADGEENAWQAHARLFTGPALGALTSETRGQNSWLNFGPHGETNRTAKVEDTVFADQKTGLMPEWTWTEGRAGDMPADGLNAASGDATDTPAFRRWFGDSKVVDRNGRPLEVYHGTRTHFDTFEGFESVGWFAEDPAGTETYHGEQLDSGEEGDEGPRVVPVYLSIQNPLVIDEFDMNDDATFDSVVEATGVRPREQYNDGDTYHAWQLINDEPFMTALEKAGYDGIRVRENGRWTWAIVRPSQAKSSIANSGAFDPDEPSFLGSRDVAAQAFDGYTLPSERLSDHLSSEAGKRLAGYQSAAKVGADKLRTYLQDYFLPVRRVQEAIQARGGQVTEDTDVYGREELYYGRTGDQLRKLEDEHVKPLVAAMVKAGVSQADLELYLYAKFAPARNARIASINPAMPDGGSGMTNADAAQVLADFERDGLTAKLEPLAQRVRAMNQVRLDVLEEGGLLSPGEAELWRAEPDYVPLKGFAEGVGRSDEPTRLKTGGGFSIGGREAHQALGRKSRAADLLANTIAQVEQAIIRAEKNRVATALLRLAEENPNPALWEVDKETQVPYLTPSGEVAYRKDPRAQLAENVVAVKIAGEQHYVTLHDKRLAAAMKNLGAAKTGAFLRAFSSVNRFLSLTRTMLAPEFVLANFSRDLQTASINLSGEQSAAMAARVVRDVPVALRAMWGFRRGKSQGGEWARWAGELAESGGITYFVGQQTVEEQQDKIKGLLKEARGGGKAAVRKLVRGTFDLIEDANAAVENATRLAAYANARRNGQSAEQAARLAKNLTVNFNRKGQAGPALNALYLFYNASVQGTARFLRAMKSPKVQAIMGATAVLGFSLGAINRAVGGEDDDGEDRWDKVPDWEKARNLIIFLPGGDGASIKIPLPYTYNLPFLAGSEVEAMLHSKRPASSAAANLAGALLTSFSPIGDIDLEGDSATAAAKLVSPTVTDPLVDIAVNRNFFGAPINPERSPFDKVPEPDSQLAFPSTNPAARWLAQTLNRLTGGDAVRPGLIDVSPATMVYAFDYVTGGTGSFVERGATALMLAAQGEDVPASKVPFWRVFKGELSDRRVTDTFYRLRDDVNLKAELAKAAPPGGYTDAADRRDALFGKRLAKRLQATERRLRVIRERRKQAQASGNKDALKTWEAKERALQLAFNTAYFDAWDRQADSGD